MCRDMRVKLISRKQTLYRVIEDLTGKTVKIEQECSYCAPELEIVLTEKLARAKEEECAEKEKVKRAHIFGRRHTKDPVPSLCMDCFIDRGQSTQMKEIESTNANGIRGFKCEECSFELRVNPGIT